MNREIKFKAKRKDNNRWIEGNLVYIKCDYKYYIVDFNTNIYNENKFGDIKEMDIIEIIPETICQYTSLKDKNGVEIYENDILKDCESLGKVQYGKFNCSYCDGVYGFYIEQLASEPHRYVDIRLVESLEVIGNIFDKVNNYE